MAAIRQFQYSYGLFQENFTSLVLLVSSQRTHPLHVGGGHRYRTPGRGHRVVARPRVATTTANQEEEDFTPADAGEGGGTLLS